MQPVNFYQENLRAFQQQIAKIPTLSHRQVCGYAKQVQWRVRLQELRHDLHQHLDADPTFAEWAAWAHLTEAALTAALQAGHRAKQRLIEAHLYLVVAIARRYQNRGVDVFDLIQEGSVGLNRGVEKFNPAKGYKLSTYVRWWIRREIRRTISLKEKESSTIIQEGSTTILEQVKSAAPLIEETISQREQLERVRQLVTQLPPVKLQVIKLRYGLYDGTPRSLSQIAKEMKLSIGQVRHAHETALEALRSQST